MIPNYAGFSQQNGFGLNETDWNTCVNELKNETELRTKTRYKQNNIKSTFTNIHNLHDGRYLGSKRHSCKSADPYNSGYGIPAWGSLGGFNNYSLSSPYNFHAHCRDDYDNSGRVYYSGGYSNIHNRHHYKDNYGDAIHTFEAPNGTRLYEINDSRRRINTNGLDLYPLKENVKNIQKDFSVFYCQGDDKPSGRVCQVKRSRPCNTNGVIVKEIPCNQTPFVPKKIPKINCECQDSGCATLSHSDEDGHGAKSNEGIMYERVGAVCNKPGGKVCVEYIKKKQVTPPKEPLKETKSAPISTAPSVNLSTNTGECSDCECDSLLCECLFKSPGDKCKPKEAQPPPPPPLDVPPKDCDCTKSGRVCTCLSNCAEFGCTPNDACTPQLPFSDPQVCGIQESPVPKSCYPYKLKRKSRDGQCSPDLYPYEMIRNLPYDEECKCGHQDLYAQELAKQKERGELDEQDKNEAYYNISNMDVSKSSLKLKNVNSKDKSDLNVLSQTSSQQSNTSKKKSKQHHKFMHKFNKKKSITSEGSLQWEDRCNCLPELLCECPQTGEYKVLSRPVYRTKEPKTRYLPNPCVQHNFVPCDTGSSEAQGGDEAYSPYGGFPYDPYQQLTPCCPCPKPDPEPDHPSYLSTKVNVTNLLKQLLDFHLNKTIMTQYYSQLIDGSEDPCEICTDMISQAVGCLGDCCQCPKPVIPCCSCKEPHDGKRFDDSSHDNMKPCKCEHKGGPPRNCVAVFESKYGKLFTELNDILTTSCRSQALPICSKPNKRNYCNYNLRFGDDYELHDIITGFPAKTENLINKASDQPNATSEMNPDAKQEAKKDIGSPRPSKSSPKRFFNFSRRKDSAHITIVPGVEPPPKRKTFLEFITGQKRDSSEKKKHNVNKPENKAEP